MDILETLSKMTNEEKVNILNGKDFWHTQDFEKLGIKSVKFADGPCGLRVEKPTKKKGLNETCPSTLYPTPSAVATTWNVDFAKELGELMGEEAALNKVNVVLTPGINIKRNPLCGRNFEYFSEDPYLAGKLSASVIKGIQANGTGACVKHFAANNQETRRMTSNSVVDERALRELYLTAFEIAVKEANPKALMTSYNKINGEYAHENKHLLSILRDEWGYDGVVISDWGGCNNPITALKNGADLSMPYSPYLREKLLDGVSNGEITSDELDVSAQRILKLYASTSKPGKSGEHGVEFDYSSQFALRCAEESIVLLKNDNVLPLNHFSPTVFTGDIMFETTLQGAGSSHVNPIKSENICDVINNYDLNVYGVERTNFIPTKKKKETKYDAKNPDLEIAVVFFGYKDNYEAEGKDRTTLSLPKEQISAYRSVRERFSKVVSVVISGGIADFTPILDSDAILYCPLGGHKMPTAILNVLTGKVNPSGKLTESIPYSYDDVPTKNFACDFDTQYRESIFVGYRYYDTARVPVLYPFGHGLSYTKFEYFNAVTDKHGIKFTVKNVGDTEGAEVCQVYVSKQESKIFRPNKELKGFTKVYLRPGEQKTVYIPFDDMTFRYFNTTTMHFEKEAGSYKIYVASSLKDIRLCVPLLISGTAKLSERRDLASYYVARVKNIKQDEFERLLGHEIVSSQYNFYKKNRIVVDENTPICDLKYAKGFVARCLGKKISRKLKKVDKLAYEKAYMFCTVAYTPLRTITYFTGGNTNKLKGFLELSNHGVFKGLKYLLKK